MDLVVVLMLLAYVIIGWRLICRFTISKGGKRWVGHALGFIFGPFVGILSALPVIPGEQNSATITNVVWGSVILAAFIFAEYRTRQTWPPKVKMRSATGRKQQVASKAEPSVPASEPENREQGSLTFSLRDTAELVLADDVVDQKEAELLLRMLDKQDIYSFDPACRELHQVLIASLDDGVLDNDEAEEIKALLSEICDRPIERPEKKPEKKKKPQSKKKPQAPAKRRSSKKASADSRTKLPVSGDVLAFSYTDSRGESSDRHISFRSSSKKNGVLYVKGICHDRQAFRTFRADRMDFICFAETGEIVRAFET